ncbi:hypothetical protein AVEN_38335-1 [Araneus ventricosus]|uniref:Uncharacterized protein n=1 Tax=Araneus ventricosus TaxID=182803 RepID=A0A4Y2PVV8_ARAVE|nr:hypothetical protein AVEN_38335-1 [Araneus ventricosus]
MCKTGVHNKRSVRCCKKSFLTHQTPKLFSLYSIPFPYKIGQYIPSPRSISFNLHESSTTVIEIFENNPVREQLNQQKPIKIPCLAPPCELHSLLIGRPLHSQHSSSHRCLIGSAICRPPTAHAMEQLKMTGNLRQQRKRTLTHNQT